MTNGKVDTVAVDKFCMEEGCHSVYITPSYGGYIRIPKEKLSKWDNAFAYINCKIDYPINGAITISGYSYRDEDITNKFVDLLKKINKQFGYPIYASSSDQESPRLKDLMLRLGAEELASFKSIRTRNDLQLYRYSA